MGLHNIIDPISNSEDVIDSRDVIARIDQLKDELEDAGVSFDLETDKLNDAANERDMTAELEEWEALTKLAEQGEQYAPDWQYGETLIRDSYFREYAEELAEDIGAINAETTWPNNCIDWERAARELRVDYTAIDFDGVTYWIR